MLHSFNSRTRDRALEEVKRTRCAGSEAYSRALMNAVRVGALDIHSLRPSDKSRLGVEEGDFATFAEVPAEKLSTNNESNYVFDESLRGLPLFEYTIEQERDKLRDALRVVYTPFGSMPPAGWEITRRLGVLRKKGFDIAHYSSMNPAELREYWPDVRRTLESRARGYFSDEEMRDIKGSAHVRYG
jgi:hypothetical protein